MPLTQEQVKRLKSLGFNVEQENIESQTKKANDLNEEQVQRLKSLGFEVGMPKAKTSSLDLDLITPTLESTPESTITGNQASDPGTLDLSQLSLDPINLNEPPQPEPTPQGEQPLVVTPNPNPTFFQRNIASPFFQILGESQRTIDDLFNQNKLSESTLAKEAGKNLRLARELRGGSFFTRPVITNIPEDDVISGIGKTLRNVPTFYELSVKNLAFALFEPTGLVGEKELEQIREVQNFDLEEVRSDRFMVQASSGIVRAVSEVPKFFAFGGIGAVGDLAASGYTNARVEGYSKLSAATKGGLDGVVQGFLQRKLGIHSRFFKGKGTALGAALAEGTQEVVQEGASIGSDWLALGKDLPGWEEILNRSMLAFTIGSFTAGGTRKLIDTLSRGEQPSQELIEEAYQDLENITKGKEAKDLQKDLDQINKRLDNNETDKDNVADLVDMAINTKGKKKFFTKLGEITEAESSSIREKSGVDLDGATIELDNFTVRQTLNKRQKDENPVTKDDFPIIPEVILSYDKVTPRGKINNKPRLTFERRLGNTTYIVDALKETGQFGRRLKIASVKKRTNNDTDTSDDVSEAGPNDGSSQDVNIQQSPPEGNTDGRLHGTAKRLIQSNRQKGLADQGFAYYDPKSRGTTREILENGPESQLDTVFNDRSVPGDDRVIAGILKFESLEAADKKEQANVVLDQLFDMGLQAGRVISAFNELKTAVPAYAIRAVERSLERIDRKLTTEQRDELFRLSEAHIGAKNRASKLGKQFRKNISDRQLMRDYDAALIESQIAARDFNSFASAIVTRGGFGLFTSVLQGNLLSPVSQVTNIVGNTVNLPLRGTAKIIASMITLNRSVNTSLTGDAFSSALGFAKGTREGLRSAFSPSGELSTDNVAGEGVKRLRPFKAFAQAYTGRDLAVDAVTGKVKFADRAEKLAEGLFGIPAEAMFRALSLGDLPFRTMARERLLREQARIKGLKGDEVEEFIRFPDRQTLQTVDFESKAAVYQQDNAIIQGLNAFQKFMPGWVNFLGRVHAPFRSTPLNLMKETADFVVPEFSLAQSVNSFRKGDNRNGALFFGKAMTGYILIAASKSMIEYGLASHGWDKEETGKENRVRYPNMGLNRLNLSGLDRWLQGMREDKSDDELKALAAFRESDETIRYTPLGVLGATLNIYSDLNNRRDKVAIEESESVLRRRANDLVASAPGVATAVYEQSFAKGMQNLFGTLENRDFDNYFVKLWGTVANIPIPNTVSAMARTGREFLPEKKSSELFQNFANVVYDKLGMSDSLTAKKDIYGRPIKQTPEGSNASIYNVVDSFKTKQGGKDPILFKLEQIYKETGEAEVIPTPPGRDLLVANTVFTLNDEQHDALLQEVGKARLEFTKTQFNRFDFDTLTKEGKVQVLKEINRAGKIKGQAAFMRRFGGQLTEKGQQGGSFLNPFSEPAQPVDTQASDDNFIEALRRQSRQKKPETSRVKSNLRPLENNSFENRDPLERNFTTRQNLSP